MWIPSETHTASTDVLGRIPCLYPFRNGTESRKTLPLWKRPETHTTSTGILGRVHDISFFHNGTESRKLLPLWKRPEAHTASTDVLGRIHDLSFFHNGTESRETLPLWMHPEAHTRKRTPAPKGQHYSPPNTFAITSSTVEQKHGMAASAADMKPREAIVSKSPRKQS